MKTPKLPNTHPNPINIHTLHPYAHNPLPQVSRDNSGQQQTPTETNRHQQTIPGTQKSVQGCVAAHVDIEWHLLVPVGVCWCMLVSIICLEHVGVPGVMFWGIKVTFRDNCGAQVSSEMCLSAQSCGNEFG